MQSPEGVELTMDGIVMGTPQYMAPEQAEGKIDELDERADVYALGGILYSILTLRPPVTGKSAHMIIANVVNGKGPMIEPHREPNLTYSGCRRRRSLHAIL